MPHQGDDRSSTATMVTQKMRALWAAAIVALLLLTLAGVLAIPFAFESPSMWYKFGMEKTSLRAGKMLGLTAGLLIFLQLPLAGRLKPLDRIFSLPGLIRQHRMHAWAIAILALIHPLCVLIPEGRLIVPLEMRYWPEWIGVGLLVFILSQFVVSRWRQSVGIAFHTWLRLHRIAGLLVAGLLVVHVLYVSESFSESGLPRLAVAVAAAAFLLLWLWVRSTRLRMRRKPYLVSRVEPAGGDCTCVELTAAAQTLFSYVPGQFAWVSFESAAVVPEPHAFTLSSTPSRPMMLQFTIRACGDWTRTVAGLSIGDRAFVQGPFGRFSHLYTDPDRELIMIAGGIGITPMLSMLRFMADRGDPRPVTLIWSNRGKENVVFADEMDELAAKLTGLRMIPICTRIAESGERSGRLDWKTLEIMLNGCSRRSAVFVCGPPQMMRQVITDLKALSFPARSIFSEVFGL
ncbi:MAG: ferric reductase-like transmembrane domain-containing protein [Desulfosarcina sp.]|nr:ferric reductase-like transmembrane domain-containing protein [Desulfosarcina sp.]